MSIPCFSATAGAFKQASTNRELLLEASFKQIEHHIDHKTGIIPWTRPLPTPYAKDFFHIYIAKHPKVNKIRSLDGLLQNLKTTSSAIGNTPRIAQLLSIFEALERWTCVSQGDEAAILQSWFDIKERAITPDQLHGISDSQYAGRCETNRVHKSGGGYIPEPLDPDAKILWCPVFDLLEGKWKFVPKSSCFFGHKDGNHIYSLADSRGVAAGPNKEFCVWNAILELIETDAGAIWNANRLSRPEIDINSFNNPYLRQLRDVHNDLGRDLWALDITMDIPGVYVFAAVSRDRSSGKVIKGFGTHPVAAKALKKAVMECCQMLPNVINQDSDATQINDSPKASAKTGFHRGEGLHFFPNPNLPVRKASNYPKQPAIRSIKDLVDALASAALHPLIQDVTRPELGFCVMRVFCPGMRSWFDRRGPGRLYDVPVKLGLLPHPLQENELNPIPVEG